MTEDDVRRIVREEIARRPTEQPMRGLPDARPIQPLPMPRYEYQQVGVLYHIPPASCAS